MAKNNEIHDQGDALSAYFSDMLGADEAATPAVATEQAEESIPVQSDNDTITEATDNSDADNIDELWDQVIEAEQSEPSADAKIVDKQVENALDTESDEDIASLTDNTDNDAEPEETSATSAEDKAYIEKKRQQAMALLLKQQNNVTDSSEQQQSESTVTSEQAEAEAEAEADNDATTWRLLLFKYGDLALAIPVAEVNNIVRLTDTALTAVESADWRLGQLSLNTPPTQVIDIQKLSSLAADSPAVVAKYVIQIAEQQWGIACEQIQPVTALAASAIDWHSDSEAPWFKGTVKDKLNRIIDVSALTETLSQM